MDQLHPAARDGFAAAADTYLSGRPSYPPTVLAWLTGTLALGPGSLVVDLGAGTGKFLPLLDATGADIVAVEPVDAMRDALSATHPAIRAMAGSATAIPLANESADAVVCAQSFHWFATEAALDEIHRVLKPGGFLGLVWNLRDDDVAWVAALADIMAPYEAGVPRQASGDWRRRFPAEGFGPLTETRLVHPGHVGTPQAVIVDRVLSVSFIAALPPAERANVERQLHDTIAATPALAGAEHVTMPYRTLAACVRKTGPRR